MGGAAHVADLRSYADFDKVRMVVLILQNVKTSTTEEHIETSVFEGIWLLARTKVPVLFLRYLGFHISILHTIPHCTMSFSYKPLHISTKKLFTLFVFEFRIANNKLCMK